MSPAVFPAITLLALIGLTVWCAAMMRRAFRELLAVGGRHGMAMGLIGVACGIAVFGGLLIAIP